MIDLSRRAFLTSLGALTATALVGCGGEDTYRDSGIHPSDGGVNPGTDAGVSRYTAETGYASLPAHFTAALSLHAGNVVALGDHNLAQFDPASSQRPIPSSVLKDIEDVGGRFLNQFALLSPTRGVVTANDGLYEVSLTGSAAPRFIPFSEGVTYASGALRVGNKLFVATANLVGATYGAGAIQVYDLDSNGSILEGTRRSRNTSRKNPTGLAALPDGSVLVLNSGDYSPSSISSLDRLDPSSETLTPFVELGNMTAQNAGEITLSEDGGTAVVGSADGTGRVAFVDLEAVAVEFRTLEGTQFHSSNRRVRGRVVIGDFNSGLFNILDIMTRGVLQTLNLRTILGVPAEQNVEAGPSVAVDEDVVVAIPYGAIRLQAA